MYDRSPLMPLSLRTTPATSSLLRTTEFTTPARRTKTFSVLEQHWPSLSRPREKSMSPKSSTDFPAVSQKTEKRRGGPWTPHRTGRKRRHRSTVSLSTSCPDLFDSSHLSRLKRGYPKDRRALLRSEMDYGHTVNKLGRPTSFS